MSPSTFNTVPKLSGNNIPIGLFPDILTLLPTVICKVEGEGTGT